MSLELSQLSHNEDEATALNERLTKLAPDAPRDYRVLATYLSHRWQRGGATVVGIGGGQGAGKSTLAALLVAAGDAIGETTIVLGIDDFYHTKAERQRLAADVHPLLATRGPPGTHDIAMLQAVLKLMRAGEVCDVPIFDKGLDDRTGRRSITTTARRIVLEGWCVGATAEPYERLEQPINELERRDDRQGLWRTFVNEQLSSTYAEVFAELDDFVYLQVPDMRAVRRWRLQQEVARAPELQMSKRQISRFVEHYERVTRWMLVDAPNRANVVVELDANHDVTRVVTS